MGLIGLVILLIKEVNASHVFIVTCQIKLLIFVLILHQYTVCLALCPMMLNCN